MNVSYNDTAICMIERGEGGDSERETDQVTVNDTSLECEHWNCRPEFKSLSHFLSLPPALSLILCPYHSLSLDHGEVPVLPSRLTD